jgi:hypothetical protein
MRLGGLACARRQQGLRRVARDHGTSESCGALSELSVRSVHAGMVQDADQPGPSGRRARVRGRTSGAPNLLQEIDESRLQIS